MAYGPRAELLLRERAYLALLLLVGAGAVVLGFYESWATGGRSISGVFDLALGACVLLVTWLFLAPSAIPGYFGDPAFRSAAAERPYLRPVAPPGPVLPVAAPRPEATEAPSSPIPRWADPMVHPRGPPAARPAAAHRAGHVARDLPTHPGAPAVAPAPAMAGSVPPSAAAAPAPAPAPLPEGTAATGPVRPTEEELFAGLPDPETDERSELAELPGEAATPPLPGHGAEVLDELDRLEAELRTFGSVDASAPPPALRHRGAGV